MRLIEWQAKFETGITSVDFEHRALIDLVNRALLRLASPQDEGAARALGEVATKIAAHFALEEKIMRDARYTGYVTHKADHERLLDEIRDIMDLHDLMGPAERAALLWGRLNAWFTEHFRNQDAAFHAFMLEGRSGERV